MSSVRVPNTSRLRGSSIRRALQAAAKSAPRRKSRFPCMMCKEGPAREHSASAPTTDALNGSPRSSSRSEEHTSELQSRFDLVCRLLLEKKKNTKYKDCITNL